MASSPLARPSVSPLSPVEHRGMLDTDLDADLDASDPAVQLEDGNGNVDLEDDRSSSLSEPEDEEDDFHTDAGPPAALAAHASLDVDSEAETERLEQTPHKARLTTTQPEHEKTGRTPSKLVHAATIDDDDALDDLSEPPSPIPTVPGGASSTSTADNAGKKRKRSNSAGSSLSSPQSQSEDSPRKRSHSSVDDETATANEPAAVATIENAIDEAVPATENADTPLAANPPKIAKKKGGRPPKAKGKKEAIKESEVETVEGIPPEEEQSEEASAKSKEERLRKQPASTAFDDIARQFASYRQKAQNDRLAELDAELAMLATKGECKHPEYLRQVACVDARYAKQVDETRAFRRFKTESIRRTTLGERSQLHSQYFQHARELREDVMVELGEDWYNIQKERRQVNQSNDELYMRKFPEKKSVQIRHQAKYNLEVSVLSGVAKYVGFPAAPDIAGAEGDVLDDDLRAMKITKRAAVPTTQPVYFPNRSGFLQAPTDRIAHEQFIEQNPWARPQGPIMNHPIHGTPSLTHTPDWQSGGERDASRNMIRNMGSAVNRNGSPYATPNPHRRAPADHSSAGTMPANSDPVEVPPSSAVPPSERAPMPYFPPRDGPAGASPLVVAKARQNGGERELTGFRNISNISGASTIDAPDSAEKDPHPAARREVVLPGLPTDTSAPLHPFDTSQLHRQPHGGNGVKRIIPDTYPNASFRPQDGAFGTPTPLPTGGGQQ